MNRPKIQTKEYFDFHDCAQYIAEKHGHDFGSNTLLIAGTRSIFHHFATSPDCNITLNGWGMPQYFCINRECITAPEDVMNVVDQFVDEFGESAEYENDC